MLRRGTRRKVPRARSDPRPRAFASKSDTQGSKVQGSWLSPAGLMANTRASFESAQFQLQNLPFNLVDGLFNVKSKKADIGWIQSHYASQSKQSTDLSPQFSQIRASIYQNKLESLPKEAYDKHYIFIGGLWSNLSPDFFKPAKRRFASLGLSFSQAGIDTSEGVNRNADHLAEIASLANRTHEKKVVLLGHSKGGVDALASLLKFPEMQEITHYLATMQSPLGGSYLADDYLASSTTIRQWVDSSMIKRISGDYSCLKDLTYERRRQYFLDIGQPVHTALRTPMLNLATYLTDENGLYYQGWHHYAQRNYAAQGDGCVAVVDAIIPGYPSVKIEGVSHLGGGAVVGIDLDTKNASADLYHSIVHLIHSSQPAKRPTAAAEAITPV